MLKQENLVKYENKRNEVMRENGKNCNVEKDNNEANENMSSWLLDIYSISSIIYIKQLIIGNRFVSMFAWTINNIELTQNVSNQSEIEKKQQTKERE